ncbi:MAG: flagellar hook-associated protein FlgL [Myxococcales bacterium]|nr:flagellar hook-associated protein FlgL [Myxococcales bacterium]
MYRVSTAMQFTLARNTINTRRMELLTVQEHIATGRKVNTFAEDPVASRKVLQEQSTLRTTESWRRTANEAQLLLETSDSILATVGDNLDRAYELTVQMANDTNSGENRQNAADEIRGIRERIVELANTQRNGRSLFAGLGNASDPFQLDGSFSGDTGRLQVPVGPRAVLDATLGGGEPFLDAAGGRNTIETLIELENRMRADDGAQISDIIDEVQATIDRAAGARQQLGHRLVRLDTVYDALDRAELAADSTLAEVRDTDIAEAVIRLRESETGLQAALSITGRLDDLSLLNFLR